MVPPFREDPVFVFAAVLFLLLPVEEEDGVVPGMTLVGEFVDGCGGAGALSRGRKFVGRGVNDVGFILEGTLTLTFAKLFEFMSVVEAIELQLFAAVACCCCC